MDVGLRQAIFRPGFQDREGFRNYMGQHLDSKHQQSPVTGKLTAPASEWSAHTFHALAAAMWLQKPSEKGMHVLDLSSYSDEQFAQIKQACEEHCNGRVSSHFGSNMKAYSASTGDAKPFLDGYNELLVQVVEHKDKEGKTVSRGLALKLEGAKADGNLMEKIEHGVGYLKKEFITGTGEQRSLFLNRLAKAGLVYERLGENYSNDYKKVLKMLDLQGDKNVLARDMAQALFKQSSFVKEHGLPMIDVDHASNEQVGQALKNFCEAARKKEPFGPIHNNAMLAKLTPQMLKDLEGVADGLIADGPSRHARIFQEVISTPGDLDQFVGSFGGGLQRANATRRKGRANSISDFTGLNGQGQN